MVKVDKQTKTAVTNIYKSPSFDLSTELKNDTRTERWNIYKEARDSIQKNNVPEMSLDEINAEILAVRLGM